MVPFYLRILTGLDYEHLLSVRGERGGGRKKDSAGLESKEEKTGGEPVHSNSLSIPSLLCLTFPAKRAYLRGCHWAKDVTNWK